MHSQESTLVVHAAALISRTNHVECNEQNTATRLVMVFEWVNFLSVKLHSSSVCVQYSAYYFES